MTIAELINSLIKDNGSIIIAGIFTIIGLLIGSMLVSSRELKKYKRDRLENFGLALGEFGNSRRKLNNTNLDVIESVSKIIKDMNLTSNTFKQVQDTHKQVGDTLKQLEDNQKLIQDKDKKVKDTHKQLDDTGKQLEDIQKLLDDNDQKLEHGMKQMEDILKQTTEINDQGSILHTMSLLYGTELTEYIDNYLHTYNNYDKEIGIIFTEIRSKMHTYTEYDQDTYTAKVNLLYNKSVEMWTELLNQISSKINK